MLFFAERSEEHSRQKLGEAVKEEFNMKKSNRKLRVDREPRDKSLTRTLDRVLSFRGSVKAAGNDAKPPLTEMESQPNLAQPTKLSFFVPKFTGQIVIEGLRH